MHYIRRILGSQLLVLAFCIPATLKSQERDADIALRNDCRLAVQVLVHGQPAVKYDWALTIIEDCGVAGADAMAHELREMRALQHRTTHLDKLSDAALQMIDVALFQAATDIAADRMAGEAARVHAVRVLARQVAYANFPYEGLAVDPLTTGYIILGPLTTSGPAMLRELPLDACHDALALLVRLAATDSNATVRLAADQAKYAVASECGEAES